jgi:hypothetical protein
VIASTRAVALLVLVAVSGCSTADTSSPLSSLAGLTRWRESIAGVNATYTVTGTLPDGTPLTPLSLKIVTRFDELRIDVSRNGKRECIAVVTQHTYSVDYPMSGADAGPGNAEGEDRAVSGALPPGVSAWFAAGACDLGIVRRLFARGGLRTGVNVDVTLSPTAAENEIHVLDGPRIVERVTMLPGAPVPAEWRFFYGGKETIVGFAAYAPAPDVVFPARINFRQPASRMDLDWTAESMTVAVTGAADE